MSPPPRRSWPGPCGASRTGGRWSRPRAATGAAQLHQEGKIAAIGLSNVTVAIRGSAAPFGRTGADLEDLRG
jgi:hypothetical protein